MERTTMIRRLRAAALVMAVAPFVAACSSMVDDESMGTAPTSTSGSNANVNFVRYAAIGTSLGAGMQSAGVNDSTQRETYTHQLAVAMGLTPGVNWFYPSLASPGCPAPYTNIGTGARVNGASSTACGYRVPGSVEANMNNTSIPGIRAYHVLDVSLATFPTDATPNRLSQFFTGNVNPITMVSRQDPTFVTLEVGANDALQAALGGDAALLTPLASFTATMDEIADSLDALGAPVAIANIPDVTLAPHMTFGYWFYCLRNGCGAPLNIPATPPFNAATFIVNTSCSHPASALGGKGDSTMVAFPTTAGIAKSLQLGAAIVLDCVGDSVRINTGAGFVAPNPTTQFPAYTLTPAEYGAIRNAVAAYNAHIATLAGRTNWTLVDINAALAAQAAAGRIPPFPNLAVLSTPGANPNLLFGTPFGAPTSSLFSQDGIHPNKAGARIMAQTFATAINAEWGTSLVIP
jgi:lysophospholipase L1-like esterase